MLLDVYWGFVPSRLMEVAAGSRGCEPTLEVLAPTP